MHHRRKASPPIKKSIVNSTLKKGNHNDKSNYQQVSILTWLSKFHEHLLFITK